MEKEREYIISVLKHAGSVAEDDEKDEFSWTEVIRTAKSLHVWLLGIAISFSGKFTVNFARAFIDDNPSRHDTVRSGFMSFVHPFPTNTDWW